MKTKTLLFVVMGALATCLALASCAGGNAATQPAERDPGPAPATAADIESGHDVAAFRAYGRTSPTRVRTRIGDLEFTEGGFAGGYATPETNELLYDEMDFQRATQAYLWALPIVSFGQWLRAHEETFGAGDGQFVIYESVEAKQGILTANATTPYVIAFADLTRTGPFVLDVPAGPSAGGINDMWQRGIYEFGISSPDAGNGVKLVMLAPGMDPPEGLNTDEFVVVENTTNIVFFGLRALQPDPDEAMAFIRRTRAYAYADRANPSRLEPILAPDDVAWGQWQPRGFAYWEAFKAIMDREAFPERDRFMLAMLESVGLEKGEPFQPDERQRRILTEAAVVGEAMAKTITFENRFEEATPYRGTSWDQLMVAAVDDRAEHFDQLYRRAAFTWEAVSRARAYYIQQPGIGQQYRTGYKDGDGNSFTGSAHYTLTMPPNPPAVQFWSVVIYDVNTRTPVLNQARRMAASSRTGLTENEDGSVVIHFSPTRPEGVDDSNWLQTNAGEGWFAYLRFYGPTEAYFDETYPLEDIERVDDVAP